MNKRSDDIIEPSDSFLPYIKGRVGVGRISQEAEAAREKLTELLKEWKPENREFIIDVALTLMDDNAYMDLRMLTEGRKNLHKCKYCRGMFVRKPRDHRSEFCSGLCRKKHIALQRNINKDMVYLPPKKNDNCVVCGASLEGKRLGTKTCSLNCRVKLHFHNKKSE